MKPSSTKSSESSAPASASSSTAEKPSPKCSVHGNDPHQITFPEDEDQTRQEFKAETDIRTIIARHGGIPPGRQPIFTHTNYDIDLHTALDRLRASNAKFQLLHPDIRTKYPSWQQVAIALSKGELEIHDHKLKFKQPATPAAKEEAPATPAAPPPPTPPKP